MISAPDPCRARAADGARRLQPSDDVSISERSPTTWSRLASSCASSTPSASARGRSTMRRACSRSSICVRRARRPARAAADLQRNCSTGIGVSTRRSPSSSFQDRRACRSRILPRPHRDNEPDADGAETPIERPVGDQPPSAERRTSPARSRRSRSGDAETVAPALTLRSELQPCLDADGSESPELARADDEWRDAARTFVRRLHLGLTRRWRPSSKGRRSRSAPDAARQPADRR